MEAFTPKRTGVHTVGVTVQGAEFLDNGKGAFYAGNEVKTGDYTLVIAHNAPEELPVSLKIWPGNSNAPGLKSKGKASVKPNSKGVAKVAILGTTRFNPRDVDESTLGFGEKGTEPSLRGCELLNVDGDPYDDLVCTADMGAAELPNNATEARLTGTLINQGKETRFEGKGKFLRESLD